MGQGFSTSALDAVHANDAQRVAAALGAAPKSVLSQGWFSQATPLHEAAGAGASAALAVLLWGADRALPSGQGAFLAYLNHPDRNGNTALAAACKKGHTPCARQLLEEGATPLPANRKGDSPLHLAARKGYASTVDLLAAAVVVGPTGGRQRAADVTVLDPVGPERYIDAHNQAGLAPLHLAVLSGSVDAVVVLLRAGASPAAPITPPRYGPREPDYLAAGSTPLHIAAGLGMPGMCAALLEGQRAHPRVNLQRARNALGLTPLNCALLGGHHDVARQLVELTPLPRTLALSEQTLDYRFPARLKEQLLGVLQRARLLVELREMAAQRRQSGQSVSLEGLEALGGLGSLKEATIAQLEGIVRSEHATLRSVIAGLESTLHTSSASGGGSGPSASAGALPGAAVGEEGEGGGGGGRSFRRRQARSRRGGSGGGAAEESQVDWTLLRAQRALALAPWGVSLSRHRRARQRRRGSRLAGEEEEGGLPGGVSLPLQRADAPALEGPPSPRLPPEISAVLAGLGGEPQGATPVPPSLAPPGSSSSSSSSGAGGAGPATGAGPAAQQAEQDASQEDCICGICLDASVDVAAQPCAHRLCFECMTRLVVHSSASPSCPFCRSTIASVEERPLCH